MPLPKVGILADDRLQQHMLSSTMLHLGFDVVVCTDPDRMEWYDASDCSLDVWLVDVVLDDLPEPCEWLDSLLDGEVPVLLGFEQAPSKTSHSFPRWQKRLYEKLSEVARKMPDTAESDQSLAVIRALDEARIGTSRQVQRLPLPTVFSDMDFQNRPASGVWVLGASLGGPPAVKDFLDALPAGLPIAFVYAQHIDERFEETLSTTIGRHSAYNLVTLQENEPLRAGQVLVAPIKKQFAFSSAGLLLSTEKDWPGPYGPSIDQVIQTVVGHYQFVSGVILFSGMGNDGSEAIMSMNVPDLPVWVQSPESCINSSMPESALETERVKFRGDPFQLANQLVNRLKNDWTMNHEAKSSHH
ncbi:MAG: chemotaxis protein CheB [Oceanobacter sp.]